MHSGAGNILAEGSGLSPSYNEDRHYAAGTVAKDVKDEDQAKFCKNGTETIRPHQQSLAYIRPTMDGCDDPAVRYYSSARIEHLAAPLEFPLAYVGICSEANPNRSHSCACLIWSRKLPCKMVALLL
jgi:hypothetical protein